MKILLLILSITTYNLAFSQYIVTENIIWSVASFSSENNDVESFHTTFKKDTLINNFIYKHVLVSFQHEPDFKWDFVSNFIREKDGKVYLRKKSKNTENTIYDFSLKVGDSFRDEKYPFILQLDSIISINIQGEFLKHYYLSDEGNHVILWIEKYGSFNGVIQPFSVVGGENKLLCVMENDLLIYQNPDYNTCHLVKTDKKSLTTKTQFIKLTSMDKGTVLIQNKTDTQGKIRFFDAGGKQILHSPINTSNIQLCLPQSGVLLYRFETDRGEVQSGKIWVN